jgi:uncharacterized membrane protein YkoI
MLAYLLVIVVAAQLGSSVAAKSEPAEERVCFTTAETREKIVAHGLSDPFHAMRNAAARLQAQVVGAKLCRKREELVYELSLLRHDGRIIHLSIDAKTGQSIGPKTEH